MPFHLGVEPHLLRITLEGEISVADLAGLAKIVAETEARYQRYPDQLVDLTAVEDFGIAFPDVLARAEARRRRALPNAIRCAIVTATPVQYGLGRMYEALLNHPQIEVQVFRDHGAALRWLGLDAAGRPGRQA